LDREGLAPLSSGLAARWKDGLFAFKKDFGATPVRQPAGSKVISKLGKRLSWARTMIKSLITGTAKA
jgi:hypothetical protein